MSIAIQILIPFYLLSELKEIFSANSREIVSMQECLRDYINYSSRRVENVDSGFPFRECFGRIWHWRTDLKDYGVTTVKIPILCRFPPIEDPALSGFQKGCRDEH